MAYEPTELDKAYAAGLFDGEGSVSVNRRKTVLGYYTYWITVGISMTDAAPLLWMARTFGGKFTECNSRTKSGKTVSRWQKTCRKAADFLELVHPHLKVKGHKATLAIELARLHRRHGGSMKRGSYAEPLSAEETTRREALGHALRAANAASKESVRLGATWGVN